MTPKRAKTKRWVGYVRVSHVGARGGESFRSPGDQAKAIERWAKALGDRVTIFPAELDESGGKLDRPILQEAIEGVEAGRFDGIVAWDLSRLSRNARHLLIIAERVESIGGQLRTVEGNIDGSTKEGRMMRTSLASMAEYQLDSHREGFDNLRRVSVERGIWQRRQTPTGYDKDPETRRLVPNRDAAKIRKAFIARAGGDSVLSIAQTIGMTHQGARLLLRNRVYLGELKVGQYVNAKAHPAIVTVAQFEAAQKGIPRPAKRKPREIALLSGILRCASCGHRMTRASSSTYVCPKYHSGVNCERPAGITCRIIDDHVEQAALIELAAITGTGEGAKSDAGKLRGTLDDARAELDAYIAATSAAQIGPDAFGRGLDDRQTRVEEAQRAFDAQDDRSAAARVTVGGADAYLQLDPTGRNAVLRSLIECVVIEACGRGRRVAPRDRATIFRRGADLGIVDGAGSTPTGIQPIIVDREHPDVIRPSVT